MAFQFSHDFHRHWLSAPTHTRKKIKADLEGIIDLLKPETSLTAWQKKHGIYHTDTTRAEQVGLFDADEEQSAQKLKTRNFPQSNFLKQVTAGIHENDQQKHLQEKHAVAVTDETEKHLTETMNALSQTVDIPTQLNQAINGTELNPHNTKNNSANNKNANNNSDDASHAVIASLETKIDDYLAFAIQNIKKDIMAWVKEELAHSKLSNQNQPTSATKQHSEEK